MMALQLSSVGIANRSIFLRRYLSSSTLGFPLKCSGLDEIYLHGLKVPISIKRKVFICEQFSSVALVQGLASQVGLFKRGFMLNHLTILANTCQPFASMCLNGNSTRIPEYEENKDVRYTVDYSEKLADNTINSYSTLSQSDTNVEATLHVSQEDAVEKNGYAKIHDFCFGIPYGGLSFIGGIFGFFFTRNPVNLTISMLGVAVVFFAAISLKVWRKGLSSLPFMLGQAVKKFLSASMMEFCLHLVNCTFVKSLAAALLVKHFQTYSLTKNFFPSGLYIFMSAAMLCFYSYVLLSGGNPPPKRNLAASTATS